MKKKILLVTLMVALFACFLAISVSAKDFDTGYTDTNGNKIIVPTYDADGDALIWMRRLQSNGAPDVDTEYYEFELDGTSYYLFCRKAKDGFKVNSNYSISIISGVGISADNLVVLNLDGLTHSDGTGIKYFGFKMGGAVKYVYLPASIVSTQYLTAEKQTFLGCSSLEEIEFAPDSQITEIGSSAFKGTALTKIVLPEGVTTLSNNAFNGSSSLKAVYIPKNAVVTQTNTGSTGFADVSGATFYFTGSEEDKAKWDASLEIDVTYVNHCDVYHDGEHQIGAPTCSRCGENLYCENPEHNLEINITYEDYMANGKKTVRCLDCNSQKTESLVSPLFTCLGYSTREDGSGGLTAGYKIDTEALDEYIELNPNAILKIGLVIVNADTVNDTIFDSDGILTGKGIQIENISTEYSILNISIDGFDAENAKELDLAMALYVKDADGYKYIQAEKDSTYYEARTFGGVTFEVVTLYNVAKKKGISELKLSDKSITIA